MDQCKVGCAAGIAAAVSLAMAASALPASALPASALPASALPASAPTMSTAPSGVARSQADGAIDGIITGPTGQPVDRACVDLLRFDRPRGANVENTWTGADGRYAFLDVEDGFYAVTADDCRMAEDLGYREYGIDELDPSRPAYVEVRNGAWVTGIDIALPSRAPAPPLATVRGTITLPEGHGLSQLCASLLLTEENDGLTHLIAVDPYQTRFPYELTTRVSGRADGFRLLVTDCDQGRLAGMYAADASTAAMTVEQAATFSLGDDGIDLTLSDGAMLAGQMVVADDPDKPVCVRTWLPGLYPPQNFRAEDGYVVAPLVFGEHHIEVSDCGTDQNLPVHLDVTLPLTAPLNIVLAPGATLTGRVLDDTGATAYGVTISGPVAGRFGAADLDRDEFALGPFPEGRFDIDLAPIGLDDRHLLPRRVEVRATPDSTGRPQIPWQEIVLERGAAVRVPGLLGASTCLSATPLEPTAPEPTAYQLHTEEVLLSGLRAGAWSFTTGCTQPVSIGPIELQAGEVVDLAAWGPSQPSPSDPTPSDPIPSDSTPSDPIAPDPAPSEPTPSEPTPPEPDPAMFSDVGAGHAHLASIRWLVEAGITNGCEPDRFCPSEPVTRDQMATFLTRALDLASFGPQPFDDVAVGSAHDLAIRALVEAEVTTGCAPGRFCPREPVTRAQMASFLMRALDR